MISNLIDFQFPAVYFPLLLNISLRIPLNKESEDFLFFICVDEHLCKCDFCSQAAAYQYKITRLFFWFSSVG